MGSNAQIIRSAAIVSVAVMFSRVLGLLREMTLAYLFEAKMALDTFYAAYRIPNLFRDLFAEGDLSKAFIAVFVDVEAKSGTQSAWRLANLVFSTLVIILFIITTMGIIFAPFIIDFFFLGKGFDTPLPPEASFGFADKRGLTVYLTRIMFPFLIMVSMAAVSMGMLNTKNRFAVPAFAPALFNVSSIAFSIMGYYIAPRMGFHPTAGAALGVLVGGAFQFLIQTPTMYRIGFRYKPIIDFKDPSLRQVMKLVGPAIISSAAMQISVYINSSFASQFDGWLTWITLSFRLMYLVVGVIGVAFSTATLPRLSRMVAEGSMDKYRETFSYAVKMVLILAIPSSAGLIALSKPIISMIYEHGVFSSYDTDQVAGALVCYAFGLCGYSGFKIARDGFYAIKDIHTPVVISLFTVSLNALLNYIFIFRLGFDHRSLAIATSCSITMNFVLLIVFLRRRVGSFGLNDIISVFIKSVIASTIMGFIASLVYNQLARFTGNNISLMIAIIISLTVLYFAYRILRLREFDQIISAIVRRVKK